MAYSEKVVEHYENPRNVGSLDKGDDNVGTGMVGAPACGDVMKLQIKVNPVTGLTLICSFITSPQAGAPTMPVPTVSSPFSKEPTLRGFS